MRAAHLMRWLALAALAGILGCGADGGVGGTGISTISGNVALGGAAVVEKPSDLEGITVGIQGTDLRTETDQTGYFEIEGQFDGAVTVEFTEQDGTVNELGVDMPSGGVVALRNVRFLRGLAKADSIEVTFDATIKANANCSGELGQVEVTDIKSRHTFSVDLDAGTNYVVRNPADENCPQDPGCSDLVAQRTVRIYGLQGAGDIRALEVLFQKCRLPGRGR